jgi:DnaK suppressor protein
MDIGTQTHLTTLRGLLASRLNELRAEVHAAELARQSADGEEEVADMKDAASRSMLAGVSEAEERLHLEELGEVERALQRLDAGSYGDCVDCGEPIALQRLLVMPAAARCTECQALGERRAAS